MSVRPLLAAVSAIAIVSGAACARSVESPMSPITWDALGQRSLPKPGERIAYGHAPQQFGELRVPSGAGPFPVVVLIHGGCWLNQFDYRYFTHLADRLTTEAGVATWTVEYRRIGDPGGGWPGTFLDVANATDHLRRLASDRPLDLTRVVAIGHSAGGHLALWLAARPRLPKGTDVSSPDPLPLHAVVGLAAITDLVRYRVGEPGSCNSAVDSLMGGTDVEQASRYRLASPLALLPLGVPQWLVQGAVDPIVPAASVRDYVAAAKRAGDPATLLEESQAGHFDPAAPDTRSWPQVLEAIRAAVR